MSVRAVTKLVPEGPGLRFYRDLDGVDLDRDESVSAAFFDDLALPPAPRMRLRYRPSLADAIRCAMSSPAGTARSSRGAAPSPVVSGSPAAHGHPSSKEQRA